MTRLPLARVFRIVLMLCVALYPLLFGTGGATTLLDTVFAFAVFAMSYDLLIGYTGIVSFGHAMFFGTGAYAVSICLNQMHGTSFSLVIGTGAVVGTAVVLGLFVAFLSLRVRDAYFAMITLAVGEVFAVLAGSQALRHLTNANDGMTVTPPQWLNGDLQIYYMCLVLLAVSFWFLRRFVQSPIGDVLRAVRENEQRAVGLGHSVVWFKTLAFIVSGVLASLAGAVFALSQAFVSTSVYSVANISLMVLLMVMIGGVGTLSGGMIGAAVLVLSQSWLSNFGTQIPLLENYPILFGILYIVVVRFMPNGLLGGLHRLGGRFTWKNRSPLRKQQI
ncbi:branched-chain amino acid ABC transporter permease [Alicyclobacillus sp. SO9]|uniref:branched-chain amino acid ABC transporter permease n=1 Tax=Alicyclobacillus sp. SO9 TaxID=2665646 RepID=UPI0018E8D378|nr:branched-chain amino acid ABC transporter permease [Alicyclobacillus sp. SO9]QQE77515.1 branched-chain amino acid ABC transporter permease [Alicyclobacillus sp. SO9]